MERAMTQNRMGTEPIGRLLLTMSVPMVLASVASSLYNVVDSMFVGMLGETALTAIAIATPAATIMVGIYFGMAIGVNVVISSALGARDHARASKAAGNGFLLIGVCYALFAAFGLFGIEAFYAVQTSDPEVTAMGVSYSRMLLVGSFGLAAQTLVERLLSSTGKTTLAMVVLTGGAVLNIALDPILMFGLLGAPALGMDGAAIATVASQCIAGAVGLVLNARRNPDVRVTRASLAPDARIMGKTFSIGLPNMITYSFTSIMIFGMNQVLLAFSAAAPAVYVIFVRVNNLVRLPVFGVRNTIVPLIAYNRGAGNHDRVRRTVRLALIWGTAVMVVGAALFELFPAQMLGAFSATREMLEIGVPAFRIIGISILVSGITVVLGGVFQAMDESWKTMTVAIVQTVSLMGSAWALAQAGDLNLVWCSFLVSEVVICILSIALYLPTRKRLVKDTAAGRTGGLAAAAVGLGKPNLRAAGLFAFATAIALVCACLFGCSGAPSAESTTTESESTSESLSSSSAAGESASAQSSATDSQTESRAATAGTSRLLYLGQASLRIVTPEGKVIYVDPYAGEGYDLPADAILVTHAHFDHNGLDKVAVRNEGCRVITQAEAVVDGEHPVFDLGYAKVTPVQAGFNSLHDVGSCVGYVIELSDGVKVYATGDTSTTDDMRDGTLAAMGIDYAFWCTDGVYNMGNDEAAEAAAMVGAKHNIPYHNDTGNSGEMFDRDAAERFDAPNKLVVLPGEEIGLER